MLPLTKFLVMIVMAVGLGLAAAGEARADPVIWTLSGVTFSDGGIASGSFVYDATSNTVSAWSITVTGGDTGLFSPFIYNPGDSTAEGINAAFPGIFILSPGSRALQLGFAGPLTDSGGTLAIVPFDSTEESFGVTFFNFRDIASGSVVGAPPVPEPATLLLLSASFTMMALRGFRRKIGKRH